MKVTSIVIAVLVAASQLSCTLAAPNNEAKDDFDTTAKNTQITIDVLTNDIATSGGGNKKITSTSNGNNGGETKSGGGGVIYNPSQDFTGVETFTYTAILGSTSGLMATVTVTVGEVVTGSAGGSIPIQSFAIPDKLSTKAAIETVYAGIFNAAALNQAAPEAATLTALLDPVVNTGGGH
jgi:hypothetical protein